MGITPRFTRNDVAMMFQARLAVIDEAIISRFQFIGEAFVRRARENGAYNDVTGNLRSSIGYAVLKNGKIVTSNYEKSERGTDKESGVKEAEKYINQLRPRYKKGYSLLVVAGMQYAAAVESRGKDVLTASGLIAERDLKAAIKSITKRIKQL